MSNVTELLRASSPQGDIEARHEAEILLGHALGRPRAWLYANADFAPDADERNRFDALLRARRAGTPIAYLVGRRGFWTFELDVSPDVLIPRPETELLVEIALKHIAPDTECNVADLGTGSGAVALAIASERPRARVLATDASAPALAVARHNAERLGLGNVEFVHGNWCAALADRRFDVIVSNPPYIAAEDSHLDHGDLRFEPAAALASGADGLDAIREICAGAFAQLRPSGWLLLEHGFDQAARVRALFAIEGAGEIATDRDLEDRDRVTSGRRLL